MDGHRKVTYLLESQQIYKPYVNTMFKNLGQEKISIYLPGICLLYFLMWTNHTNYCILEHHRNKIARDSTFTCSLKSTSSYHFICIFLYFSMTTSTYCFSKKDSIRQMGLELGRRGCLYSSSFQSSFHPLSYKNENFHRTLAR